MKEGYIKSIASGDGSIVARMASGPGGAVGPWDSIPDEMKALARDIASSLPEGWSDDMIISKLLELQGLN